MSGVFTVDFINEQIATLKLLLEANAAARIAAQGTQSYTLESGQTRQSVMKAQLSSLADERARLLYELGEWSRMLCGSGAVHGVPGW